MVSGIYFLSHKKKVTLDNWGIEEGVSDMKHVIAVPVMDRKPKRLAILKMEQSWRHTT